MHRTATSLLALLTLLLFSLAVAVEGDPADPLAEPLPEEPQVTTVRVIHLSPNAPAVDISLASTDEAVAASEEITGVNYGESTDYLEVPAGEYNVTVTAEGETAFQDTINFNANTSYTVAAIGIVIPGEPVPGEETGGGGFFSFFEDLFGGGEAEDAYTFRLELLEDINEADLVPDQLSVRVFHAAPGVVNVDLVALGTTEEGEEDAEGLVNDLAFGNASDYVGGDATNLEVRLSGSNVVAADLSDAGLEPGTAQTVFVTGTPIEEAAPLQVIVLGPTGAVPGAETGGAAGPETGGAADEDPDDTDDGN